MRRFRLALSPQQQMRIAIIGNSGSGKSTLARKLANSSDAPLLDLDTIVWEPNKIAVLRDQKAVFDDVNRFCGGQSDWVIEGCYANCIEVALQYEPELVFLDPGRDACIRNCRNRPWEPHKYASKAEQDSKLEFLLRWVADYYERDGDMSLKEHNALFENYPGPKRLVRNLHAQHDDIGNALKATRS